MLKKGFLGKQRRDEKKLIFVAFENIRRKEDFFCIAMTTLGKMNLINKTAKECSVRGKVDSTIEKI